MSQSPDTTRPAPVEQGVKLRGAEKVARIPVKVIPTTELPRKPDWIRVRISNPGEVQRIKNVLREQKLHTVCEEAACPNLPECFGGGTATFMIMGDICTRRCPFCDVAHGRPNALDADEPKNLADTVKNLKLNYVVVTSVDRDDLKDGGAQHFVDCIRENSHPHPKHQSRNSGARFPWPHGYCFAPNGRVPARCVQPQYRNRAAHLQGHPPRL
jgi:lipoic acid synthetase